jgi:acyl-CoA synthetase (AMP-forming)/AMP-acid ligase II
MRPLPGIGAEVVDDDGSRSPGGGGYLVLTKPWPAMLRGIWGDPQRYKDTYWSRWPQYYFAGDGAKLDETGNIWLLGRVDDVMNVSGHRISTTEVESALVSHPAVAEAAVVGATDETTGQAIVAFVILRGDATDEGDDDGAGAAQPRGQRDRPDRQAAPDHDRARAAQDPLRQDHAPPAQGRRRGSRGRRRRRRWPTPRRADLALAVPR